MISATFQLSLELEVLVWCWEVEPAVMLGITGSMRGLWSSGADYATLLPAIVGGVGGLWVLFGGWKTISVVIKTLPRLVEHSQYNCVIREGRNGKKNVFFRALPESPKSPPPWPQFGQLGPLFSEVEIQDLKVGLELKILYILYNILYICNLKNS